MDICEGCFGSCAAKPYKKEAIKCPCIECLIKVTCFDACEEWHKFFNVFSDKKKIKYIIRPVGEENQWEVE